LLANIKERSFLKGWSKIMELENLVLRAKNGDTSAYEDIFNRFKNFIYKTCIGLYINGYEMEDLLQLGNITLIKAIEKYDPTRNKNFTAYATYAIRNNYFYEIRQKSKFHAECSFNKETEEGLEILDMLPSNDNIEKNFLIKEEIAALKAAVSKLPPLEKDLIEYVYFNDGRLIDFAKSRNIKYSTCCKLKERVIKKLRKNLGNLGDG
jgi:RNA polymerase sporulation-specific sigma factor